MAGLLASSFAFALILPLLLAAACLARLKRKILPLSTNQKPRLVWAGVAIGSLHTASNALKSAGFDSICIASTIYENIDLEKFDTIIGPQKRLPFGFNTLFRTVHAGAVFTAIMFQRDVLHGFFNGAVLGKTPLAEWEYLLWKVSGGKLILLPYGSDSFVYRKFPDEPWANAIKQTYPRSDLQDRQIETRINQFTEKADCVVGCIVHDCCLPRVDERTVLWYPFDTSLEPEYPDLSGTIKIAHSTNHRKIKGTDALISAVNDLKQAGYRIDLTIIENKSHSQVTEIYRAADIVVDQLLFGYAFSALEGLALGKPVITGVTNEPLYQPYLALEQMQENPMIFCSPQTIKLMLEKLLDNPSVLNGLGKESRQFAEKYHGNKACSDFFSKIYDSSAFSN